MIRDNNGHKMSPRQKAADILLSRLGSHSGVDQSQIGEMTEREVALVNRQIEKIHNKHHKNLMKIKKEDSKEGNEE
jgi:hypothetical protein